MGVLKGKSTAEKVTTTMMIDGRGPVAVTDTVMGPQGRKKKLHEIHA